MEPANTPPFGACSQQPSAPPCSSDTSRCSPRSWWTKAASCRCSTPNRPMIARTSGCESGFRPDTPPSKRALNPKPTQPTPATRCTSSTANGNSTSTPCKMSSIPRRRASPTSRTTARAAIRPTTTAGSSRPRAPSYRTAPTCCTAKAAGPNIRDSYSRPTTSNRGSRSSPSASATPRRNTARRGPSDASKNCSEALS